MIIRGVGAGSGLHLSSCYQYKWPVRTSVPGDCLALAGQEWLAESGCRPNERVMVGHHGERKEGGVYDLERMEGEVRGTRWSIMQEGRGLGSFWWKRGLAGIWLIWDSFPHMIEARNGSKNIQFHVLYPPVHTFIIHIWSVPYEKFELGTRQHKCGLKCIIWI